MEALQIDSETFVVVMTGAGCSAESGIPTFRDSNGLWEGNRVEDVATPRGFMKDPQLVWKFYSERRQNVKKCDPNPGHLAIADLEQRLGDRFLLLTQNVDDLHERAGSRRIVKMHGSLFRTKCSKYMTCPHSVVDREEYHDRVPTCPVCGAAARPDIVWFEESLDPNFFDIYTNFFSRAQREGKHFYYVAVGTSGNVMPAAGLVHEAQLMGAEAILVNLDLATNALGFDRVERGKSGELLPVLFGCK